MSLNKTGADLVVDLINEKNYTDVEYGSVAFVSPTVLSADPSLCDTEVEVHSVPRHGYTGEVSVKYSRIELGVLFEVIEPVIEIPDGGGIEEIAAALGDVYSVNFVPGVDFDEATDVSTISFVPSIVSLSALSLSVGFKGSIDVTVSYDNSDSYSLEGDYFPVMTLAGYGYDSTFPTGVLRTAYCKEFDFFIIIGTTASNPTYKMIGYDFKRALAINISGNNPVAIQDMTTAGDGTIYTSGSATMAVLTVSKSRTYSFTNTAISGFAYPVSPLYFSKLVGVGNTIMICAAATSTTINRNNLIPKPYLYDIANNTWKETAAFPGTLVCYSTNNPPARCSDGVRYVYLLGGTYYTTSSITATTLSRKLLQYDLVEDVWTDLGDYPVRYYEGMSLQVVNGNLYSFGGKYGVLYNDKIRQFDFDTNTWSVIGDYVENYSQVSMVRNNSIFIYSGKAPYDYTFGRII